MYSRQQTCGPKCFEIMGVFHFQNISENFYWELPFGKSAFHLSQVHLREPREAWPPKRSQKVWNS